MKVMPFIGGAVLLAGALATAPAMAEQPRCELVGYAAKDVARMDNQREISPGIAGDVIDLGKAGRTSFSRWNAMMPTDGKLNRSGDWPPFWTWNEEDLAAITARFRECGREQRAARAADEAAGRRVTTDRTSRFFKAADKLEAFYAATLTAKRNRAALQAQVDEIVAGGKPTVDGFGTLLDEALTVVRVDGVGRGFAQQQAKLILEAADAESKMLAERIRADLDAVSDLAALEALKTQAETFQEYRDRLRKAARSRGPFGRMSSVIDTGDHAGSAFYAVRQYGGQRLSENLVDKLEGDLSGASAADRMRKYHEIYNAAPAEITERAPDVEKRYKDEVADRYFSAREEIEETRCAEAKAELDTLRDAPIVVGNDIQKFGAFVCELAGSGLDIAYDSDGLKLTLSPGELGVDLRDSDLEPFDKLVVEFEMQSMSHGMTLVGTAFEIDGERTKMKKSGWWRLAGQLREVDLGI